MKQSILLMLLVASFSSLAQQKISGKIVEKESNEALIGATVLVYPVSDTTKRSFAVTDFNGDFTIVVSGTGFYTLFSNYLGFTPIKRFVRINEEGIDLGEIALETDPKMLDAVEIRGSAPTAVVQGDTTGYDASAYKTNPDANTEDLLRKLPGILIDNIGIQAQGESVQRVLVDGKVFFGNDPSAALKNLPADVVQRIEVFDQLSDQARFSGFNDGNTTKTINIVTKQEFRDGLFGRTFAGAGSDEHFNFGGNLNSFKGDRRFSMVGLANDINQQNFSSEDLVGISSSGGSRGGWGGPGGGRPGGNQGAVGNFLVGQDQGLISTYSGGLNFSNKWGKKLELESSYFYNMTNNQKVSEINRETFLTADSSQLYNENTIADNVSQNHRSNIRLTYNINDNNTIIFTPSINFQQYKSLSTVVGNTAIFSGNELNSTDNSTDNLRNAWSGNTNLLYRHRFEKQGRTISLNVSNVFGDTEGALYLDAINEFTQGTGQTDTIKQFTDTDIRNQTNTINLSYTEPITEKTQLQLSYANAMTRNESDQLAYGGDNRHELRTALSSSLINTFNRQTLTTGIFFRGDKAFGRIAVAYQDATLDSDQAFPSPISGSRNFKNVLPTAFVRLNISKEKNIRFIYRTQTDEPSINQLQSVINNSNPVNLSTGNPDLKQAYSHLLVTRYSSTNLNKGTSMFGYIFVRAASNYIVNETTIATTPTIIGDGIVLRPGAQLIRPINVDGFWNVRSLITYTVPVRWLKSNVTFSTGGSYSRTPGVINDQENLSLNRNVNQIVTVASNFSPKVDFTLTVNGNYNNVNNSLQPELNNNFFTNVTSFRLNWILGNGFVLRQDINHQLFRGLSGDFNQEFLLWNASIGKKLFANQQGEISLNVFDLLNQNNSINRSVTETFIEDTRTNILRQYVLLTFTYNIKKFGTAEKG